MRGSQRRAAKVDRVLFQEEKESFIGCFRVPFKLLKFNFYRSRSLDTKNVDRIKGIYRTQGCLQLQKENYIAAIISREVADNLLRNVVDKSALIPPTLSEEDLRLGEKVFSLDCLYGQHRIEAAKKFLPPSKHWWCINIYSKVTSQFEKNVREEYQNAKNFTDGEIFWNILASSNGGDYDGERKWWARLSRSKARDLRQLFRSTPLKNGFSRLLPFKGLWPTIQLGAFHRLLTLKCEEEILHYLTHIFDFWSETWGIHLAGNLDAPTVTNLQSRCPGRSLVDEAAISNMLKNREIFSMVEDSSTRETLLSRFKDVQILIPSFFTFFEDLIQLEACANAIKKMIGFVPEDESLRETLQEYFRGKERGRVRIQVSENAYRKTIQEVDCFNASYMQLWLFAMRHYPELGSCPPKKEIGQPKPISKGANRLYAYRFASLAQELGFSCEEIANTMASNIYGDMATDIIQDHFFPFHKLDQSRNYVIAHRYLQRLLKGIQKLRYANNASDQDEVDQDAEEIVGRRCGRTYEKAHEADRCDLFLGLMGLGLSPPVTSLDVKKTFFDRFWGSLYDTQYSSVGDESDDTDSSRNELNVEKQTAMPRAHQNNGEGDSNKRNCAEKEVFMQSDDPEVFSGNDNDRDWSRKETFSVPAALENNDDYSNSLDWNELDTPMYEGDDGKNVEHHGAELEVPMALDSEEAGFGANVGENKPLEMDARQSNRISFTASNNAVEMDAQASALSGNVWSTNAARTTVFFSPTSQYMRRPTTTSSAVSTPSDTMGFELEGRDDLCRRSQLADDNAGDSSRVSYSHRLPFNPAPAELPAPTAELPVAAMELTTAPSLPELNAAEGKSPGAGAGASLTHPLLYPPYHVELSPAASPRYELDANERGASDARASLTHHLQSGSGSTELPTFPVGSQSHELDATEKGTPDIAEGSRKSRGKRRASTPDPPAGGHVFELEGSPVTVDKFVVSQMEKYYFVLSEGQKPGKVSISDQGVFSTRTSIMEFVTSHMKAGRTLFQINRELQCCTISPPLTMSDYKSEMVTQAYGKLHTPVNYGTAPPLDVQNPEHEEFYKALTTQGPTFVFSASGQSGARFNTYALNMMKSLDEACKRQKIKHDRGKQEDSTLDALYTPETHRVDVGEGSKISQPSPTSTNATTVFGRSDSPKSPGIA